MKQSVRILGIFIGVISALVVVFSRLITITDKIKSIKNAGEALNAFGSAIAKVFGLMSIAAMVAALSFSIMMLTDSLATLSQIETKDLWKGLAVLVILLAAMTAIILVLSKNTVQLTMGTVLIFAYSYALKLFSNALANITKNLIPGFLGRLGHDFIKKKVESDGTGPKYELWGTPYHYRPKTRTYFYPYEDH